MGFQLHSQLEVETDIKSVALFKVKKTNSEQLSHLQGHIPTDALQNHHLCFSFRESKKESAFSTPSSCQECFIFL